MAIYRYKNAALVDRVEITSPRPNTTHAVLVAAEKADAGQLEGLRQRLGAMGYSTLMDSRDGRARVQVRGIKNEESFVDALEKLDLSHDGMQKDLQREPEKKPSFSDRVRGKAFHLSAIFYNLGNIAFIISGIMRGRHNKDGKMTNSDWSELGTGVAFSVGDVLMMFFGEKGDEELQAASQGLKKHLHQKGIEIPKGDTMNPDSLHQSGLFKATDRWLRKHIVHIKCLSEFAGGLLTIYAGMKPLETLNKHGELKNEYNKGKILAGFLISTGWLATFLLEKPPGHRILDGNQQPDGLTEMASANPRGWIARPAGIANNLSNLWGSLNPWDGERTKFHRSHEAFTKLTEEMHQQRAAPGFDALSKAAIDQAAKHEKLSGFMQDAGRRQHDYAYNVFSACSFIVGHLLFGLSGSKKPRESEDDKSMMNDLVLMSANVLAKSPEPLREMVIGETADYISGLAHVKQGPMEIADALRNKIADLSKSTWAARVTAQPPASPGLTP